MSLHAADLRARLMRFLGRKEAPRHLAGKDAAQEDEIRALLGAVARAAPADPERLALWWPVFEACLGEDVGRFWPDERQIRDAAKRARAEAPQPAVRDTTGPDMRAVTIAARRMQQGEPVGEEWLYGRQACEMIREGLVSREAMERYRSAAYLSRRGVWGEAEALAWEAAAKARHEEAKATMRGNDRSPRTLAIPVNRVPAPSEEWATA